MPNQGSVVQATTSGKPLTGGTMTGSVKLNAQTETNVINTAVTGAVTVPCSTGTSFQYTLTGNATLTFGSVPAGAYSATFILTQDSTGSRTVTWPSIKWAGGTGAPTLSTTAGAIDIVTVFTPDGVTWFGALVGKAFA